MVAASDEEADVSEAAAGNGRVGAYLDRDGVDIYYELHGSGPVVLLSHGYSATSQMWRPTLPALAERYRVVTWDMRGHGRSSYPDDQAAYSEEATVADMAALLDEVGAERAVIAGLSLGGFMSLAFNLVHSERVAALMLFSTGPGFRSPDARARWNDMAERFAARLEQKGLDGLGPGAEVRAAEHSSAEGLVRAARGMLAQRDARVIDSLPQVTVPALVVVGERDEQFLAAAEYMSQKMPDARKVVLRDAGHAANIDQPEAFNRAVLEFLEEIGW